MRRLAVLALSDAEKNGKAAYDLIYHLMKKSHKIWLHKSLRMEMRFTSVAWEKPGLYQIDITLDGAPPPVRRG